MNKTHCDGGRWKCESGNIGRWTNMAWSSEGIKSSVCFCKRHILACIRVVWAILREDRLGPPESRSEKSQKVMRDCHRKDMSPLTQWLNYSLACDKLWLTDYNDNVRHKSSNISKNTRLTPCCTTALCIGLAFHSRDSRIFHHCIFSRLLWCLITLLQKHWLTQIKTFIHCLPVCVCYRYIFGE